MDDVFAMGEADGLSHAQHQFGDARDVERFARATAGDERAQRLALQTLHQECRLAIGSGTDVMHRHDCRVFELGGDCRFALEGAQACRPARHAFVRATRAATLECDLATKHLVARGLDDAHAASTQPLADTEASWARVVSSERASETLRWRHARHRLRHRVAAIQDACLLLGRLVRQPAVDILELQQVEMAGAVGGEIGGRRGGHVPWFRRRRLLPTTVSDEAAIAAAAIMGSSSHPVHG